MGGKVGTCPGKSWGTNRVRSGGRRTHRWGSSMSEGKSLPKKKSGVFLEKELGKGHLKGANVGARGGTAALKRR